jgi:type I restriction enzyme S subunit
MAEYKDFKEPEGLPEGWKWVRFKDYVYFQEGPGLTSDLFEGRSEGIPFLNIRCIQNNQLLKDKLQFLDENIVRKHFKHFLLQENDLVVSSSGTLGRTLFIKKEHLPLLLNTSIIRMRPMNESLSRFYLKYFIESEFFQKEIYRLSTGSAQSNYGPSHLKRIFLILPPLPEQRKIAEILETVDNAIEKTEKIIEKYKRIKQGLMQDLLTKGIDENGNIRSEKTHKFKDSPIGRIPEEWEVVRLGEVSFITSSKRIYYDEYLTEGVPFFRSKEIIELFNGTFSGATLYISYDKFKNIMNKFGVPEAGDILITAVGTLGVVYLVKKEDLPFYFKDGNLLWLKLREKLNKVYFVKCFNLWYSIQEDDLIIGTSQPALTIEKLKKMLLPLPPLQEQQRIAEILSQIDQTIEKEQQYKEKLEHLKQGLMQDLLTGKVRVNHLIEEGAENVST